jgi:hypothetical protein
MFPVTLFIALQIGDMVKWYSHLLGQTELLKHFIDSKVHASARFLDAEDDVSFSEST